MIKGISPIKRLIEACGSVGAFVEHTLPAILNAENERDRMTPEEFSLAEIFEAVNTTEFSVITSELISAKVIQGYEMEEGIIDELVVPFNSSLQTDKIPGAFLEGNLEDIPEGGPYPHSAKIEDKYVQIGWAKRGMILDITMEAIKFDQTGMIMTQAQRMGEKAKRARAKEGMYTIQDATVSGVNYYAYYPAGTRRAIYANAGGTDHTYDNLVTDALADYSDIQAADLLFGVMKDDAGDPITIRPKILLVPRALGPTALRAINNQMMPNTSASTVGFNEENPYYKAFKVLVSSYIDAVSNNDWYLGDFKRQFVEKVVFPLQVLTRTDEQNDLAWERDLVAQYKVRRASKFGATDYRFVVKSTGGS